MTNKEAIKYLKLLKYDYNPLCPQREALRLAIRALEERPKGKWIKHSTYKGVLICSHCNHGETQAYDTFKFCPYCGADMRGDV